MTHRIGRTLTVVAALVALAPTPWPAHAAKAAKPAAKSLLEDVEIFQVDAPHSAIDFSVRWMGVSRVRGAFHDFTGIMLIDRNDPTRSSVTVIIPTDKLTTGLERRDKDLKGPDFFDVAKFPIATFSSREIVKSADGYVMRGDFTLKGVTKAVEIPFTDNGRLKDQGGDDRIGFDGALTLRRKDYGIVGPERMNAVLERGIVIGEDVTLALSVEGFKPNPRDTLRDRTADSLYRAVLARGVKKVAEGYRALRATTPDSLMAVSEGVLNVVGYQLLFKDRAAEGLEVFRLQAEAYPSSAFARVAMGQAYATIGDREAAIASCEEGLRLNPRAPRALELLKRLRD